MKEPITAKQAEGYTAPFAMIAGNYEIKAALTPQLQRPVEHNTNVLIEGEPGSGKTGTLIAALRELFTNKPFFYREEFDEARIEAEKRGQQRQSLEELREWVNSHSGKLIYFIQIDGATDSEAELRRKILTAQENSAEHSVVLCDELGELFFRGFDEALRPMLTSVRVTTFATAQNFHSKRKAESAREEDQRLAALFRRFTYRLVTENPTSTDHAKFLAFLIREWSMKLDDLTTIHRLVERSKGNVGYSKRTLVKAIDLPDRRLTLEFVESTDVDPHW